MTYDEICTKNVMLYTMLEELTMQIEACKRFDCEMNVSGLVSQKDEIKDMLTINLDKLEAHWQMESKTWMEPVSDDNGKLMAGRWTIGIIDCYLANPGRSLQSIATEFDTNASRVSGIITKLLNKQYIGY